MKYEITVPGAQAMIDEERATDPLGDVPIDAFKFGRVAFDVAARTERNYWLDNGGERSVQYVLAMVGYLCNNPGYARPVLHEALQRVRRMADGPAVFSDLCLEYTDSGRDSFGEVRERFFRAWRRSRKPVDQIGFD